MTQTMTAPVTAARFPALAAGEIALPARERGAFLVVAGAGDDAAEAAFAIVRTVVPGAVRVAEPAPGFRTLDGIAGLFAALLPVIEQEAPDLLEAGAAPGSFLLDPYRVKRIGVSHIGESVTFAVTRRISRESHDAALVVDRIARSLLEVQRRCPTFREGLALFLPGLERWDRPCLRCLYRAVLLAEPDDRLTVVATTALLPADPAAVPPGAPRLSRRAHPDQAPLRPHRRHAALQATGWPCWTPPPARTRQPTRSRSGSSAPGCSTAAPLRSPCRPRPARTPPSASAS